MTKPSTDRESADYLYAMPLPLCYDKLFKTLSPIASYQHISICMVDSLNIEDIENSLFFS